MTSKTGQEIVTIHILLNISRSTVNQKRKLGQLIEYKIRNIFLKNHIQNMVKKPVPDLFLKNLT